MYWVVWPGNDPSPLQGASEEWAAHLADIWPDVIYFYDGTEG